LLQRKIRYGKARPLQIRLAALAADRPTDDHHPGVLLLARRTGAAPERPATRRLWDHCGRVRGLGEFQAIVLRPHLLGLIQDHGCLLAAGGIAWTPDCPAVGSDGQPCGPGRTGVQDPPHLALRRRASRGGRALAHDVCLALWRGGLRLAANGPPVGPPAECQPCHGPHRHGCSLEADLLQLPVLPRGTAIHSAFDDRGRDHRRRHALEAFLEHRVSAVIADHVLPARHQRGVRVL
jgi:hypothetical protein